ncbi:MAG: hypothetical protein ACYS0I_16440 [Planctomycetota bacterium]
MSIYHERPLFSSGIVSDYTRMPACHHAAARRCKDLALDVSLVRSSALCDQCVDVGHWCQRMIIAADPFCTKFVRLKNDKIHGMPRCIG